MRDDCLYETPDVEEALRRLPEKLMMERNFRMARAVQLSGAKKILPKNEWTKYEDVSYINMFHIVLLLANLWVNFSTGCALSATLH